MDQEINVKVGAQITELNTKMVEAGKSVSNFAVSADGSLVVFRKSLDVLQTKLGEFKDRLKTTVNPQEIIRLNQLIAGSQTRLNAIQTFGADAMVKYGKGTNTAAFALTNLGRVAQDAPFGFIGIQNNLNPLLESFQRLKQETGSAGSALKALGRSLIGPAGIGVALSVVTAAILFWPKIMELYKRATEDGAAATEKLSDQYLYLNEAFKKGNAEAGKEVSNLKILYKAATDAANSTELRTKAAIQLQKQFPETFKQAGLEAIKAGELGSAYRLLTEDIIKNARAKAIADKIGDLESKKLDNQIQQQKTLNAMNNELSRVKGDTFATSETTGRKVLARSAQSEKEIIAQRGKMALDLLRIDEKIIEQQQRNLEKFTDPTTLVEALSKPLRKATVAIKEKGKEFVNAVFPLEGALSGDRAEIVGSQLSAIQGKVLGWMSSNVERFNETNKEITDNFIYSILNPVEGAFVGFFNDILTKGTFSFKQLGQNILATFAQVLSSAIVKKLVGLLLNIGTGGTGGGVLKLLGGFGKILGFANGTSYAPGGLAMVGERGPELVNLPRGSQVMPNGSFGGVFIANSYIRGTDIVTSYNRGTSRNSRIN